MWKWFFYRLVLPLTTPLGLRAGALAATLILFAPALVLLGCISPYLVRLAAREVHTIGRTVGGLYALSTVGSVIGTVLTGFLLIENLGVNFTFYVIGASLLMLAATYFVAKRTWVVAAMMLVPMLLLPPQASYGEASQPSRVEVIHERFSRDTHYGSAKVVDYSHEGRLHRRLMIDGLNQGDFEVETGLSLNHYHYMLQFLPYRLNPVGRDCLVVGLGAGFIPRWYSRVGIRTDVVDIDPVIPEIAREYFSFATSGDVIVADARHYLNSTDRLYDYIILDAYNGDLMPHHLLSREVFAVFAARLRPGGVLAINFIGSLEGPVTASILATLRTAFEFVDVYPLFDVGNGGNIIGSVEIVAYQGTRRPLPDEDIPGIDHVHPSIQSKVRDFLAQTYTSGLGPAVVLTDDFNPIDFIDAPVREAVRKGILAANDRKLLLQ